MASRFCYLKYTQISNEEKHILFNEIRFLTTENLKRKL